MKLYLLIALFVSVALARAQPDLDDLDSDSEEFDEFNGGSEDSGDASEEPYDWEVPDEDEDYDDDEIVPTTAYPTTAYPTKMRWPGYKCMLKAKMCLMNATDCEEHLACYEEKTTCMQAVKKDQKPFMKKPSKMVCKTMFNKCMERAGSDCFKKYMCYKKKGFCYRSRGRAGHQKPCGHHFRPHHRRRPHHHGRLPTMNPEMMKCKIQWRQCFMIANSCSERLQCMFDFHHCMNRSRPTGPPPTMSPDEDEEDSWNVYRRRWNPKLVAKCKGEFKECIANSSSCPLKMKCFWRMKMCFKPHHRPHYGYKKKMMLIKITGRKPYNKFGGQWRNREMRGRHGQTTGRHWGHRQMGRHSGETGRQWGNRGRGSRYGQTTLGRRWGKYGREMGRRIGETGRQWGNRGFKRVEKGFKPIENKFKNMWERHLG